ncbi:MAG: hypothetical protein K0B05_11165 [Bacteroidales bacterium]|nr:hypothetical protein [Bacteroidales bacterium]
MKMPALIISVFFLVQNSYAGISNDSLDVSARLEDLFTRLHKSSDDEVKIRINDSVRMILSSYAASDTLFTHRFDNLRTLGQITSPDSLLKILTWNLFLADGTNKYHLYIIRRSNAQEECRIYNLSGQFSEEPVRTDTVYSESDWYGALYYDAKPFSSGGGTVYVLLGIDFGNSLITRKMIEVLSFRDDGSLVFGKEWFITDKMIGTRVVIEYGSSAVASMRFVDDSTIAFDHLVPVSPEHGNDRRYYVPDYSLDAWIFKNGFWELELDVDVRNRE